MKKIRNAFFAGFLFAAAFAPSFASAHGDVTPHPIDTQGLEQLGAEWRDKNPYSGQEAAIHIGTSGYGQNCARCHGLQAISGGIAPDLRRLDLDCKDMTNAAKKAACFQEVDKYFLTSVRRGKSRNDKVYMPPFEGILSQEAIWAIRSYIQSVPFEE